MAISSTDHEVSHSGWLEIDPQWLTYLFQTAYTGQVKVVDGKIHVGIRGPSIPQGAVCHGIGSMAFVPHGIGPKGGV